MRRVVRRFMQRPPWKVYVQVSSAESSGTSRLVAINDGPPVPRKPDGIRVRLPRPGGRP